MTRTILITAFVFSCLGVFGQSDDLDDLTKYQDTVFIKYNQGEYDKISYVTDTVIFLSDLRRNILIGTTIFPQTSNQYIAYWEYGLKFDSITKYEFSDVEGMVTCCYENFPDTINSILLTDSTLKIEINIVDNCCYDFICDIEVDTAGVLHLIFIGYGSRCFSLCYYGLTYHLTIDKKMEDISEIKAVMIGDNRKTLKEIKR